MSLVVVKYNAGNVASVMHALQRLNADVIISDDPDVIVNAEKILFPGVGEASSAMAYLRNKGLDQVLFRLKQPVLGICLGMQLLCQYTEENDTHGIGVFSPYLKKFDSRHLIVPHMGWNQVTMTDLSQNELSSNELFRGVNENSYVYFAHSYYAPVTSETLLKSAHGFVFSAALQKDNFYGVQFHPEKSGETGERILRNFLSL